VRVTISDVALAIIAACLVILTFHFT